jgi:hypothetical protein
MRTAQPIHVSRESTRGVDSRLTVLLLLQHACAPIFICDCVQKPQPVCIWPCIQEASEEPQGAPDGGGHYFLGRLYTVAEVLATPYVARLVQVGHMRALSLFPFLSP